MTPNQVEIAGVTLVTLVLGCVAFGNSRTQTQNLAQFKIDGQLNADRGLPVVLLVFALLISLMAFVVDHGRGDRTWGLALIGTLGMLCACFLTLFTVRLEQVDVRFGMLGRKRVAYSEIAELLRVHFGKGADIYLVLKSGQRITMGEGLPCEKFLAEEIQKRAGCKVTWHTKGMPPPEGF